MAYNFIDNVTYSGRKFLDGRQRWNSLDELNANVNIIMPNGYEVFCDLEGKYYRLSTTDESDTSTYKWSERKDGNIEISKEQDNGISLKEDGIYCKEQEEINIEEDMIDVTTLW